MYFNVLFAHRGYSLTQLSKPRKNSMRKNSTAQMCGNGNIPIASGYVTNANDGPPVATEDTGMFVISAYTHRLIIS